MQEQKNFNVPGSLLILIKDDKVLLLKRINTWYWDGTYHVPSGHVEFGENFTDAMIREAKEEAWITLTREQLKVVHIQHKKAEDYHHERVHVYFLATAWTGEVQNIEPNKCSDLSWFSLDDLPKNLDYSVRDVLKYIQDWVFYSEFGW